MPNLRSNTKKTVSFYPKKNQNFSTCVSFGQPFDLTLVELKFAHKSMQVLTVWPPNTSRHKLIASQLYIREVYDFLQLAWTCEPTCESVWPPIASPYASSGFANLHRLAGPFGHPSQVRTQVLVLQTIPKPKPKLSYILGSGSGSGSGSRSRSGLGLVLG